MQLRNIKEDEATFRVDICSRFVPILGATMKGTIEELGRETKVSIRITALPGNYLCLMIPGILSIMAALSLLVDIKNISRLVPIIFILIIYIPYFFRIQSYYWIALSKNLHNTLHREENE
jgi:hypothetical protein